MIGMLSCKQVTQTVSESLDRKLPFWTRVQLQMHLGMCGLCRRFRKDMIRVDEEVRRHAAELEQGIQDDGFGLSPKARDRLKQKLDANDQ